MPSLLQRRRALFATPALPPFRRPLLQAMQNFWLSIWSNATEDAESSGGSVRTGYYMLLYFVFGASSLLFQASGGWVWRC